MSENPFIKQMFKVWYYHLELIGVSGNSLISPLQLFHRSSYRRHYILKNLQFGASCMLLALLGPSLLKMKEII